MKKLLSPKGRIPRSTFWNVFVCSFFVLLFLGFLTTVLPEWAQSIIGLLGILVMIVNVIAQIKRWHDRDKSGVWVLINIIPFLGLWTIIECGFLMGTDGDNRFGPDPLEAE